MSTNVIFAIAVSVLTLLVLAAYTTQGLERARARKRKLELALKKRIARLTALMEAFPPGFLTRELAVLIGRGLVDAWEQLCGIERGNRQYSQGLTTAIRQLESIRGGEQLKHAATPLETAQHFLQVELNLSLLHKLVDSLAQRNKVSADAAQALETQIRHLSAKAKLGHHRLNAREAEEQHKPRLAIHHLQLALAAVKKLGGIHFQAEQAELLDQIANLEAIAREQDAALQQQEGAPDASSKEWEAFSRKEEDWKKKAIYD